MRAPHSSSRLTYGHLKRSAPALQPVCLGPCMKICVSLLAALPLLAPVLHSRRLHAVWVSEIHDSYDG